MDKENREMRTGDILVVDDDIGCLQMLSLFLESEGFDVTATSDGAKALEILENNKFKMIITDFNMPAMNGVELAIKVRERHSGTPIVLLTGSEISAVIEEAVSAGISEIFCKPLHLKRLTTAIRSLLYPWQKNHTSHDLRQSRGGSYCTNFGMHVR
jgi:DNA-binding response OmpR family regulator